jgi:hypothetical protein
MAAIVAGRERAAEPIGKDRKHFVQADLKDPRGRGPPCGATPSPGAAASMSS